MNRTIVDSFSTECRIAGRIGQETWGGLRRTGWMNLLIMITMASILSIFGVLLAFVLEMQSFLGHLGSTLEISVYMSPDANLTDTIKTIKNMDNVRKVELVTREQAWNDMKRNYETPDIPNPLPDTLHVQMAKQDYLESAVAAIQNMRGVEKVSFPQQVLATLKDMARIASAVGMAVSVFLGILTLFIISNTIHLLIEARGREIEILRMMGVGNWYIRLPFLLQGAVYGLVGAFIARFPLGIADHYMNQMFALVDFATSGSTDTFVFAILILMGILVGAGGAAVSVHKYLRV